MLEIIVSILILIGAIFNLIGSIGLVKLPDFFTRLHAPTKATTLGIGSILLASFIYFNFKTDTLSPQKEALIKLYNEKISWLNEYQKIELRETNDQLIRHIEELDTIRDKIMLIQDELVNNLSQELNSKMYIMAIISAIFLPLTFLTGLLGINVGGIPGAENENAFYIFTIVLLFVVTFQFFIFKKSKWI
jgi:Mg2+ and Co2+ transporter CorA